MGGERAVVFLQAERVAEALAGILREKSGLHRSGVSAQRSRILRIRRIEGPIHFKVGGVGACFAPLLILIVRVDDCLPDARMWDGQSRGGGVEGGWGKSGGTRGVHQQLTAD